MNKIVFATFVAFWSSIATIATLQAMEPGATPTSSNQEKASEAAEFTLAQVAQHATLEDCWIAIDGTVYDITNYVPKHPPPDFVLEQWCGKDATEGMRTKGYGGDHSPTAWGMLETYRTGLLVQ